MKDIWTRIEAWLSANAPQVLETLKPGASEDEIRKAEERLSVKLPEDVKASYRIHDGQTANYLALIGGMEFLSLERIQDEWGVWKELLDAGTFDGIESQPRPGIRNDWWNPRWIPLTYDGAGNHLCLDMDPTPDGQPGQIITMWHDGPERELAAGNYREWLGQFADDLESGRYVFSEDYDAIVSVDDV